MKTNPPESPSALVDPSEQLRLRAELAEANLARAEAATAEYLATLSHDIRTPLNTILGMAELLGETQVSPDQARLLQILKRAGRNLLAMVDGIQNASALAAPSPSDSNERTPDSGSLVDACGQQERLAPGEVALAGLRVLLVDDSAESRALVETYLAPAGAQLRHAADASSAIDAFSHETFDAVLLDLNLPTGRDGLEVTRELRRIEHERGVPLPTPIVALSGDAAPETKRRAREAGFTEYLVKPYRKGELVDLLRGFPKRGDGGAFRPRAQSPTVAALLPRFLSRRERDIHSVSEAIARRDFQSIATIGHNLRGNGVSYGFPELSALGARLEAACQERNVRRLESELVQLQVCVDQIRAQLAGPGIHGQRPASGTHVCAVAETSAPAPDAGRATAHRSRGGN